MKAKCLERIFGPLDIPALLLEILWVGDVAAYSPDSYLVPITEKSIATHRNGNHIVFRIDLNPMFQRRPRAAGDTAN